MRVGAVGERKSAQRQVRRRLREGWHELLRCPVEVLQRLVVPRPGAEDEVQRADRRGPAPLQQLPADVAVQAHAQRFGKFLVDAAP